MKQRTPTNKGKVRLGLVLGLIALIVVTTVFAVGAAGENPFEGKTGEITADCSVCGANQTWLPLTSSDTGHHTGHYYLPGNVTISGQLTCTSGTLCLELNGFTLARSGTPVGISGGSTLSIFDSSTGATGCVDNTTTWTTGIEVSGAQTVLNQYGGKIQALKLSTSGKSGGAVKINSGTYNLYGGTVSGKAENGGGVYVGTGAAFNMFGGTITGCNATSVGGGVYVAGTGTFKMSGGTITQCSATTAGGSVCINGTSTTAKATMEMTDGTITGGTAADGGNIEVRYATVTVSGNAKIQNGEATTSGGNFKSTYTGAASITIKGNAEVSGGQAKAGQGGNINIANGALNIQENCTISNGTAATTGGSIHTKVNVNMSGGTIESSYAANKGGSVFVEGGTFTMTGGTVKDGYCYSTQMGGNFCVEGGSVKMSGGKVTGGTTRTAADTVSSKDAIPASGYGGNFAMRVSTTLEISGTAEVSDGVSANGGNIWAENAAQVKINGGTISDGYASYGGNINLSKSAGAAAVTMTDGLIKSGVATTSGGNVYLSIGSFSASAGTVQDGLASSNGTADMTKANKTGGNIYIGGSAAATLSGTSKVTGGHGGNGGSLYVETSAALTLADTAEISGAWSQWSGAGIYSNGTITATGGTIKNCETPSSGGCVVLQSGTATLTDVTVSGGEATGNTGNGGNILVNAANLTIDGDSMISGGVAGNWGGNIAVANAAGVLNVQGNTVIDGTGAHCRADADYGNNIALNASGAKVNFAGSAQVIEGDANGRPSVALAGGSSATLAGSADVDYIYVRNTVADNTVTLKSDYAGEVKIRTQDNTVNAQIIPGQAVYSALAKEEGYTGAGAMVRVVDASGTTYLTTVNASDVLITAGLTGFTADGLEVGLPDLSASSQYAYIKLYADGTYTLTGNTTVDLNNCEVTINTGTYQLAPIDWRSDAFQEGAAPLSRLTVDNDANVQTVTTNPVTGYRYINVKIDTDADEVLDAWTSNRFELNIQKVSLKPGADSVGAYYTTRILANKNLTQYLQDYGVAVSAEDMPDANFAYDSKTQYTSRMLTEDQQTNGVYTLVRSALLENILDKNGNGTGENDIYVTAYATFTLPGTTEDLVLMADVERTHTLKELMVKLDTEQFASAIDATKDAIVAMYNNWLTPMANWGLTNIAAYAASKNS